AQPYPGDPRRPGQPGGPQAAPLPVYPAPAGNPFSNGNRAPDGRDYGDRGFGNRLEDLRGRRQERVEDGGRRVIIEEPGDRRITREGDQLFIRHNETDRFRESYRDADVQRQRRGDVDVTVLRQPNGLEIVTERDEDG
ncbi:flagellar motor protein MotB, partial [Corallococcus exiguus]|nr:flagellar motor protein MotB [Corallococcus exiguus]